MNKNEIKSNNTKKKLCDTYIKLYQKKNIEKITIREITEVAGYNRATFYIYYKDVYDIHEKIREELIKKAHNKARKIIQGKNSIPFEELFKTIMFFFTENENTLLPFITKDNEFSKNIKEILKPILSETLKIEINEKTDYLIEYHLSAIFGIINYWNSHEKSMSINELFTLLQNVSTRGVLTVIQEN